jgi:DUF4097 and DUF4098 domain-containing protein YvlB
MRSRTVVALAALALVPLAAACGQDAPAANKQEQSYEVTEAVKALVVDAQAARVIVEAGDGPVTVTEIHRYDDQRPTTTHKVDGQTLTLTQTGCGDGIGRCDVEYRVRVPGATSADITAAAGGVTVTNLAGNVTVTTQAGAIEGSGLSGDEIVVSTKAGAATLEFTEAPSMLRATTDLGAIELKVPGDQAYAVNLGTTVGASKVTVQRDDASTHKIEVRTKVGAVSIAPR